MKHSNGLCILGNVPALFAQQRFMSPRVLKVLSVRPIVFWLSQKRLLLYLDLRMYGQLKFAF